MAKNLLESLHLGLNSEVQASGSITNNHMLEDSLTNHYLQPITCAKVPLIEKKSMQRVSIKINGQSSIAFGCNQDYLV